MTILKLPSEVASQIAAGEVVERPASVVKELVENSLDAGARQISIVVESGGRQLIEVTDDGCGIPQEELSLAVSRHATSKLTTAEDLFRVKTLGFRGEALASVGSVSRLEITSRTAGAEAGARLVVDGGHAGDVQQVGAPVGTAVRVKDLFYNVPARLKFLKKDPTERRWIDALVTRYALAYSHVRIHLKQENRAALQTSGSGDRREILAALYGVDVAHQMLEVLANYENLKITGFISPISLTRSNRREITFFVNGRWVQDPTLTTALVRAYHTLLMVGRYPFAMVFLDMPSEQVDVNVHPAKAEVRFREKDRVFSGVQRAVRRALLAYTPVPALYAGMEGQPEEFGQPFMGKDLNLEGTKTPQPTTSTTLPSQPDLPAQTRPVLRLVGQVASTYLAAEGPDGLYLIDQHAAHERVLFEKFMSQMAESIPGQSLLEAEAVDFPPSEARLLLGQLPALQRLGFLVEEFGPNTFLVRAIPTLLVDIDPAAALRVLVEDFLESTRREIDLDKRARSILGVAADAEGLEIKK
ncbi:MAG: DNA mismatch repair endonuclease MutL, partial [Anaerolineales bacterium]|nr:DNA mismatch repair endonuclease MutL [Anaerolineales bacterium]